MNVGNVDLKRVIEVTMQKKAQDVVKNVVGKILENTFENTKAIEKMVANETGKGVNINLQG
ncbi:MAG TPA: shikimate kinase [Nautiliaceae bacterium]|nr:shikimate kinase [Nautiliaceae bacterium]